MRNHWAAFLTVFISITGTAQGVSGTGWPEYGGSLSGQRYSNVAQITTENVKTLQPAWVFHTHYLDKQYADNNRASFEATPVLWNDVLYFDTAFDQIFAVDAATGKLLWQFDPEVDRNGPIYIVTSRGVSLWHAKKPAAGPCGRDAVFVATVDRRLIGRDAKTGKACPRFGVKGTIDLTKGVDVAIPVYYEFTSPPTIVGDMIVLGSSVGDNQTTFAASGAVRGFDAITGKQMWSWEPVRWGMDQKPRPSGSGNAWSVISADPQNDLIFVPTGSASSDYYGGTRIGDNRDADSLVALRASTGQKVWSFQLVHHDIWDYDTPSEPVLFTFRGSIPAVAVATKTDMVYVFNRLTGEPLYPVIEKPVPASNLPGESAWPTQPFSSLPPLTALSFTANDIHLHNPEAEAYCKKLVSGLHYEGIFTPPSRLGSMIYPGSLGGANWGSSALDPTTNILYTRISSTAFLVKQTLHTSSSNSFAGRLERKIKKHLPESYGGPAVPLARQFRTPDSGGEERDESPQAGTPYNLARQALMTPDEIPCAPSPFGSIVALNLDSGKIVWSVAHGEMVSGEAGSIGDAGVIVTAGGLVFGASSNDGTMRAYSSTTGALLWTGKLLAPSQATPMTYSSHGRQFVVVAAGGHGFIGHGQSDGIMAFALPKNDAASRAIRSSSEHRQKH